MAEPNINIPVNFLKKLDHDCKTLHELLFEAIEVVRKIKATWGALAEIQKLHNEP